GSGIAIDVHGGIYITGFFLGTVDFDPGPNIYPLTSSNDNRSDSFITKLDASGIFVWTLRFTTSQIIDITTDISGGIYIVGGIHGVGDYDPGEGTHYLSSEGTADIFIEKLQQAPLGVDEYEENRSLSVFPVPSGNSITVNFGRQIT